MHSECAGIAVALSLKQCVRWYGPHRCSDERLAEKKELETLQKGVCVCVCVFVCV